MKANTQITALLVDDEPKAIKNLMYLLKNYCQNIKVVAVSDNVDEALILIRKYQPSVVFLDIEMPLKSGFDLLEESKENFQTIFVTAYDNYAVKAFEVSATDYLLKPITIERLIQAVEKLENQPSEHQKKISILKKNYNASRLEKIVIPNRDSHMVIDIENIICFEANQSYCIIHTNQNNKLQSYIYSKSLKHFNDILNEDTRFFRCNRSWLINLKKVKSYSKKTSIVNLELEISALISKNQIKELDNLLKQLD